MKKVRGDASKGVGITVGGIGIINISTAFCIGAAETTAVSTSETSAGTGNFTELATAFWTAISRRDYSEFKTVA